MTKNVNTNVLTTPIGFSGFSTLAESQLRDDGFGYSLDLFLDKGNEEHVQFLNQLEEIHKQNLILEKGNGATNNRDLNVRTVTSSDFDFIPSGSTYVRIKLKSNYAPTLFDSNGKEITLNQYLPFMSQVRARITIKSYTDRRKTAGTSLYLQSVQIAKLGETKDSGTSTEAKGFNSIDGGDFVGLGTNVDDIQL